MVAAVSREHLLRCDLCSARQPPQLPRAPCQRPHCQPASRERPKRRGQQLCCRCYAPRMPAWMCLQGVASCCSEAWLLCQEAHLKVLARTACHWPPRHPLPFAWQLGSAAAPAEALFSMTSGNEKHCFFYCAMESALLGQQKRQRHTPLAGGCWCNACEWLCWIGQATCWQSLPRTC